jgi:hypothetical protein
MILFADDASITITDTNKPAFNITINKRLQDLLHTWLVQCQSSYPELFKKTYYMEFRTKNNYNVYTQINYEQKCLTNTEHTNLETTDRTSS